MISPIGNSSSRLARIQQRAKGSRARPRDLAKPTEQHIAHPKNTLTTAGRRRQNWNGPERAGKERKRGGKRQSSWGARKQKQVTESAVCVSVCECV